jgi:CheY-like chemotaxis protein
MMDQFSLHSTPHVERMSFYQHEVKNKRILIVDDDVDFRLLLSEILVGQGYSISTAKNGKVAIRNLEVMEELPSLILLDSHMPEASGRDFLRWKAKIEKIHHIPVILITGDSKSFNEFTQEEVLTCLLKPLDLLEVIDVVQQNMAMA